MTCWDEFTGKGSGAGLNANEHFHYGMGSNHWPDQQIKPWRVGATSGIQETVNSEIHGGTRHAVSYESAAKDHKGPKRTQVP